MLFSSLEFLFLFLPLSIGIYFILPKKLKNLWLLLSGICFYGIGEPIFLPLMLLSIALNFLLALAIERARGNRSASRALLLCAVIYNVGTLIYFKFFSSKLPIGISFYSFQALSYIADVYAKSVYASHSIVDFGAYLSLYPQLIAGPIVKYGDVAESLRERAHTVGAVASGIRCFIAGLCKKVILANAAGELWELFGARGGVADAYFGIFAFSMQIYFDFSGYSDMAVGLGRIFGFEFLQNFNYPYVCRSISDFWRRWHITLSSFFREYVYIPLGGNRRGRARTYLNLAITWALTGIWHGASLNFLCWGLYFALILIAEKAFLGRILEKLWRVCGHVYALSLVGIGWLIFASDGDALSFFSLGEYLRRLVGAGSDGAFFSSVGYDIFRNLPFAALLALGATPLPRRVYRKIAERSGAGRILCELVAPLAAFLLAVAYIVNSGYDPFLYFRF